MKYENNFFPNIKVLIGDYNKFSLLLSLNILKELKINYDVVKSGTELINKIKLNNNYDIIITNNVYKDGYDGYKLLKKLKEIPTFNIPIVVLTVTPEEREYFIEICGFDDYIIKPLTKEKLLNTLKKIIKNMI